jgi:uncharacterized protein
MTDKRIRLLSPADYHSMPWKNGLGVTTELLRDPPDPEAGPDQFRWRLSIAEVATSGPFSLFPGCDRQLLVLDGDGFRLNFADGESVTLSSTTGFHYFSGERVVSSELVNGPTRDFNIIFNRAAIDCMAKVVALGGEATAEQLDARSTLALHPLTGEARFRDREADIAVPAGWTLLARPQGSVRLSGSASRAIVAELRDRA